MILGARTYAITRREDGEWINGVYQTTASAAFSVRGSLQPLDADSLSLLPEGARSEARWILLCDSRQTACLVGDRVDVEGKTHLVLSVADWTHHTPLAYRAYVLGEVTGV
jgi:hypothetical protein